MLVLHASTRTNRFILWGERPAETPALPRRSARRVLPRPPEFLPYTAGPEVLSAALVEALQYIPPDVAIETAMAWLPSAAGRPVASSPLISEQPGSTADPELTPWMVTTLNLSIPLAIDLLCACLCKETLAPGIVIGKDLASWGTGLRRAGALVARKRFLPTVEVAGTAVRARWKPVLTGADANRVAQLARAMPQACRALTATDTDAPPAISMSVLLSAFLDEVVDSLVRLAGVPVGLSEARCQQKRTGAFDSVHDQWLHALRSAD